MIEEVEHHTDEELMLLVKKGDLSAFRSLVGRYKNYIMNICYGYLPDRTLCEDLAQEVFFRVYRSSSSYVVKAKFLTWLTVICRNTCLNEIEKRKTKPQNYAKDLADMNDELFSEKIRDLSALPEDDTEISDLEGRVRKALAALPEGLRVPLMMAVYNNIPYEEIADALGLKKNAVKTRICRAREMLRELLFKKR